MPTNPAPVLGTHFIAERLSTEQREVFNSVVHHRYNTVVNAVAGSGKTRTALTAAVAWLAARPAHPSACTTFTAPCALVVAYNRLLRCDVDTQVATHVPIPFARRIHIHTYHSLAGTYFHPVSAPLPMPQHGPDGENQDASGVYDAFLQRISGGCVVPGRRIPRFGLVIVDEAQDMTPTLYDFLSTFLAALPEPPQLLMLGDPFQLLYGYRSASDDYMLRASEHFGRRTVNGRRLVVDAPFTVVKLSTSFRITPEIAQWVNEYLNPRKLAVQYGTWWVKNAERINKWWGDGIRSGAASCPGSVRWIVATHRPGNTRPDYRVFSAVDKLFEEYGDDASVMLAVSTKSATSPGRRLVEEFGDQVTVQSKGRRIGDGPRMLTTITSFKGLERDAVVLLGFDSFFEKLDAEDPLSLLNKFYVAATRARKKLLVVQFSSLSFATARSLDRILGVSELTEEQRAITDTIAVHGHNAIVSAVAGSGKTRTALTTAIEWLRRSGTTGHVLLVTYNKRLEQEMTAQRNACVPSDALHRIEIRTIHGLGHTYFGGCGLTKDRNLRVWTRRKSAPVKRMPAFGLVIIDEAQDLTIDLYRFLHFVISLCDRPQLLILGDPFQLLYAFKGAKEEFLTNAREKFGDVVKDAPFLVLRLSICFRITHEMAAWINKNLDPNNLYRAILPYPEWFEQNKSEIMEWWGDGIRANPKRGPDPGSIKYFRRRSAGSIGNRLKATVDEISEVFEEYDTDSSAMLCHSIVAHQYSPVRLVTNNLYRVGTESVAWMIDGGTETRHFGADVYRNKRIASTIHKFKGRERDAIVLLGLDSFAEKREKLNPRNVFNMFYVAATRARKKLLIIQWEDIPYATHMSRAGPMKTPDFIPNGCPVTKALTFCAFDETLCQESTSCLSTIVAHTVPPSLFSRDDYIVRGAHHGSRGHTLENVASIIGVGIEIRLQLLLDNGVLHVPNTPTEAPGLPVDLRNFLQHMRAVARERNKYSWAEVLRLATACLTVNDLLFARWRQTQDFEAWEVVRESQKLDGAVLNLVQLLYIAFCCGAGTEAAQNARNVSFEDKLAVLRMLRAEGRIVLQTGLEFDMTDNPAFAKRQGPVLKGIIDVALIPPSVAAARKRQSPDMHGACAHGADAFAGDEDESPTIIVEIKATSAMEDDHRLQVGCYGAMWLEAEKLEVAATEEDDEDGSLVVLSQESVRSNYSTILPVPDKAEAPSKIATPPKLYLAYPNLGQLRRVFLSMDSLEFLHRIGFRKLHMPFDPNILSTATAVVD